MISRICLCQTFFAFLVTSYLLLKQRVKATKSSSMRFAVCMKNPV
ncbi:hypothetical protein T03_14646 [Trichinella britovi]|uniref:Uncharacterized protein n=1 Tax=Trichinella britovi TaxID=45882 RepID=A0A0V0YXE4_TRIBR|nr:hypothetical protein T03_14646 [Trichinella britovi]